MASDQPLASQSPATPPSSLRPGLPEDAPHGLAYYRVSTSRQANTSFDEDGFSIQAQREYCQRKAAELGVRLVGEYVDRGKSARSADRPALQAMLARVKEDTDIQYVFVHKLDRLARNRADDVQIGLLLAKHGVRLVSCTENIDDSPSGKLVRGIMGDIAEWYSANLSEEAKKGMRKKVELGGTPGKAPLGYVNERRKIVELGKDIGVVLLDEVRAPIITECFKLYDSGQCTLSDVTAYANDRGLRMPATKRLPERPITVQQMQWLLRNHYYTGWVTFSGVRYQGSHAALIDEATFDRVQALLTARELNKDKSRKRPHHLKGRIFCACCGRRLGITVPTRTYTGQAYPYFFCLGRQVDKNSCPQAYLPIGDIEDAIRAYWGGLRIPAERIYALRQVILDDFAGKREQGQSEIARQKRRITELEQRRHKAKAAYYADALELDEFKREQETIQHSIQTAEVIIAHWNVELESIAQALDHAFALVENPQALYDALPEELKTLLMQAVFEKVWILDTAVVGCELTEPFAELLTLDARLTLAEKRIAVNGGGTTEGNHGNDTYYRCRTASRTLLHSFAESWDRLHFERPYGPLPIDKREPTQLRGRSSKIQDLVGVIRFNLKAELATFIEEHTIRGKLIVSEHPASLYSRPQLHRRRIGLNDQEIVDLITAFKTGVPKHEVMQ